MAASLCVGACACVYVCVCMCMCVYVCVCSCLLQLIRELKEEVNKLRVVIKAEGLEAKVASFCKYLYSPLGWRGEGEIFPVPPHTA